MALPCISARPAAWRLAWSKPFEHGDVVVRRHRARCFKSEWPPCFSLLSDLSKNPEVTGFWRFLLFFIIRSLFFSKITLISAK